MKNNFFNLLQLWPLSILVCTFLFLVGLESSPFSCFFFSYLSINCLRKEIREWVIDCALRQNTWKNASIFIATEKLHSRNARVTERVFCRRCERAPRKIPTVYSVPLVHILQCVRSLADEWQCSPTRSMSECRFQQQTQCESPRAALTHSPEFSW